MLLSANQFGPALLVIDGDLAVCTLLSHFFSPLGFKVTCVLQGTLGLQTALKEEFDLILLDVARTELDGLGVLRQIRKHKITPVIILSSSVAEEDRIAGFDAGADDYLGKPFSLRELLARVHAILRRSGRHGTSETQLAVSYGRITLSSTERAVVVDGNSVILTGSEFEILASLLRAGGRVVTRQDLRIVLYHSEHTRYDRSMDVHISHLRKKLSPLGIAIRTVRGHGYVCEAAAWY